MNSTHNMNSVRDVFAIMVAFNDGEFDACNLNSSQLGFSQYYDSNG